jgi:hypothetical protein
MPWRESGPWLRAAAHPSATLPPYAAAFAAFLLLRRFTPLTDDDGCAPTQWNMRELSFGGNINASA